MPNNIDGLVVDKVKARELHDELLTGMPEGARHDADICSFCVDKAAQEAPVPSGPEAIKDPEGTEGGTTKAMADDTKQDMISKETHDALLEKALKDATSVTTEALVTAPTLPNTRASSSSVIENGRFPT